MKRKRDEAQEAQEDAAEKDKGRTACSKKSKPSLKVGGVEDDFLGCLMLFRKPNAQEFQLVRLQHKSIESMSPTMYPKGTTSSSSFEEWLVPDDGNCLFAAFAVAHICCLAFS